MSRLLCLLLLLLAMPAASLRAQAVQEYCNQRFGYCLSYDPALLKPAPEAQNGDGRIFKDGKGADRLSVYGTGSWTFSDDGSTAVTLAQLYRMELRGGRFPKEGTHRLVTYKTMGKTAFVLSGTEGGEVFYMKVVQRDDAFCYAWLHYPASEADRYQAVAVLVGRSFH